MHPPHGDTKIEKIKSNLVYSIFFRIFAVEMIEIRNIHGQLLHRLDGADSLACVYLDGLDLRGASLAGADLSEAYLGFCDLSGADFRGADLSSARIEGCVVSGTDFSGADLSGADIDSTTDIATDAVIDDETLLPSAHRPAYM